MSTRVPPPRLPVLHCSRRAALRAGGLSVAAACAPPALRTALAQDATPTARVETYPEDGLSVAIGEIVSAVPGAKAFTYWAPPDAGRPAWSATRDGDTRLFIASAFKSFVLAAYLQQAEENLDPASSTPLADQLDARLSDELTLDEAAFVPGSPVFNPPNLTGKVTARTALEAMIAHSDNTAADMALRQVGPERVRQLIASLGLAQTQIPASIREFFGYVAGDPDWLAVDWPRLQALFATDPYPHRPLVNDTITAASTPDDLVAFYERALRGDLFRYAETLAVFRAILSTADLISLVMPLGMTAFIKGGSFIATPDNAQAIAGGLYLANRWVYFAMLFAWTDEEWGSLIDVQPALLDTLRSVFALLRDRLGTTA